MAERAVTVEFVFDRAGAQALAHAYRILVPERRGRIEQGSNEHDERSHLRPGVLGPPARGADDRLADDARWWRPPSAGGLRSPPSGSSRTRATRAPRWSVPPSSGCGTWPPRCPSTWCCATRLTVSPGSYAYQALLIDEFARAGTEVRFVKGPRAETPEDELLIQFQGMIAEYERAQIAERTRRGKTHRARAGVVNVLGGAPVRLPLRAPQRRRRGPLRDRRSTKRRWCASCSAATSRTTSRSPSSPDGSPPKAFRHLDGQGPLGSLHHLGHAAQPRLCRPGRLPEDRTGRWHPGAQPHRPTPRPRRVPPRPHPAPPDRGLDRDRRARHRRRGHVRGRCPTAGGQPALLGPQHQRTVAAHGPGVLPELRLRLLPHLDAHQDPQALLLPLPRIRRLPLRARPRL